MEFKVFIGIDVSKSTLDVHLKNCSIHNVFSNDEQGLTSMIEWIMENSGQVIHSELLLGFEHTGLYSEFLIVFLNSHHIPFTVIPGLELKKSLGIRRGKSDKADSRDIAEYIYEKREKIKLFKMPSINLDKLRKLASYRERLVKEKTAYKIRIGEYQGVFPDDEFKIYIDSHKAVIECLDAEIKKID